MKLLNNSINKLVAKKVEEKSISVERVPAFRNSLLFLSDNVYGLNFSVSLKQVQWLVWSLLFIIMFLVMLREDVPMQALANTVITVGFYALVIYGNAYGLLPRLYRRNKVVGYVVICLVLLLVVVMLRMLLSWWTYNTFFAKKPEPFAFKYYLNYFVSGLFVFLFSIVFRLAIDYFSLRRKQEELTAAHAQAQLSLLKAQVQPHFVFNTLNNIYYVAQKESPVAAEMIERLSNTLRYFVDEGTQEMIPLKSELRFLHDYSALEKLRMRYPLDEQWKIEVNLEEVRIPPMLLVPLVENVFKHGIDKRRTDNFIEMTIQKQENDLLVTIRNRWADKSSSLEKSTGTGIQNLRNRLKLLYGNNYRLDIHKEQNIFTAQLKIPV